MIKDGVNGYLVPVGDIEAFADRLERLCDDSAKWQQMSNGAFEAVSSGRFRVEDMVESYAVLCAKLAKPIARGSYTRPRGRLNHPPPDVGGVALFPIELSYDVPEIGAFPRWLPDYREFWEEIRALEDQSASPVPGLIPRLKGSAAVRMKGLEVIVASPAWIESPLNDFAATLVRGFIAKGVAAHVVLTEHDTRLVDLLEPLAPLPTDIPFKRLPTSHDDSWIAHWGAMIRHLEDHAPCIYIPNHDWRHSCVSPLLSDRVMIVGVVHGDDPQHLDHAHRLGRYWNALVTYDTAVARKIAEDPELAPRTYVISYGPHGAALDYLDVFDKVIEERADGSFRRPAGTLEPPPREIAGKNIFPIDLPFSVGASESVEDIRAPKLLTDYRVFTAQLREIQHPELTRLRRLAQKPVSRLQGVQVIVASPAWLKTGVNDFSAALVRELLASGVDAHVLLTEEDTDLVEQSGPFLSHPPGVPFARLPVDRGDSWGGHWGAMIRYLEDRAPCIYLPNHDWRHSCVCPVLSDQVAVVGILHRDEPLYHDLVGRLGRYWNATVAYDLSVARQIEERSDNASRLYVLSYTQTGLSRDYLDIFSEVLDDLQTGRFHRAAGTLLPPPRAVDGTEIFPTELPFQVTASDMPNSDPSAPAARDYRDFKAQLRQVKHPERSSLARIVQQQGDFTRLEGVNVIVGSPLWTKAGVNDFSAALVRELTAGGVDAHVLLTEEDTDLVRSVEPSLPHPGDVRFARLPVGRSESWGGHWGAMIRYLEDHAPCIYIPNHDWRHACVSPLLSDRVAVVGVMHGKDLLYADQAQRLGRYWNAIVAYDPATARTVARDPQLAGKIQTLAYAEQGVALEYVEVFNKVLDDLRSGAFQRPAGTLRPPPRSVAGTAIFPTDLPFEISASEVPTSDPSAPAGTDYREFKAQLRQLQHPEHSPIARLVQQQGDFTRLRGVQVIVGSPTWVQADVNNFSATLVRELVAGGVAAHILVTEEDTDLVRQTESLLPHPPDVPFARLPVGRSESWGGHWGAMIRYLEDHAPCIYIPNHDWRHACVSPLLSDRVAVVGILHGDDPLYRDQAQRLGRYWNALVAYDAATSRKVAADPELASKVHTLAYAQQDVALDYVEVFNSVLDDLRTGTFRRPSGLLQPPPRAVDGIEIFPTDLSFEVSASEVPTSDPSAPAGTDYREFKAQLRQVQHPEHSPIARRIQQQADFTRLHGVQVIVASPVWVPNGVNEFSATLVRELVAGGIDACVLLTEEDTDLVEVQEARAAFPPDVPFERLPVGRGDSWGAHWGAMIRYLEDRAPCIYIPNHDWRHACVSPLLSDGVAVVGILHGDDPLYDDQAHRLGRYWNALVAYNAATSRKVASDPELASKVHTLAFAHQDIALDYVEVFNTVLDDVQSGAFHRPPGPLQALPREVAGREIFPADLRFEISVAEGTGRGAGPRSIKDHREFRAQLRQVKHPERSPLASLMASNGDFPAMRGTQVIVASPLWVPSGVNDFSAALVRELLARGVDAHVLLTEEDTDLINVTEPRLPYPSDVPFARLPVQRDDNWEAHWAAMIRYLEDRAPCIYLPNHDWRHSCVCPVLSDRVAVVGILHAGDSLHYDHAHRLGRYWNALVAYDTTVARRVAEDPELASRVYVLPYALQGLAVDYLELFRLMLGDLRAGTFRRPAGILQPPPREVAGIRIFGG